MDRSRNFKFRQLVALWLRATHGLPTDAAPWQLGAAQKARGEGEPGHLWGLPDVLINTRSEVDFLPGEQVDRARAAAAEAGKPFFASVQHRRGIDDPGASLVFTDLATFAGLLQRLAEAEQRAAA